MVKTETEDIDEDFKGIKDELDFSGYDKTHPNYDTTNKKVLCTFKDEMDGAIMIEFIGLQYKTYCCKVEDHKTIKKAK
eukprot:15762618-Heterocapsa_arctica.AAC.1